MNRKWLAVAGEVIRRADRDHPADAALRHGLQATRGLNREDRREISRLVFCYFRWRGWLEGQGDVTRGLSIAAGLDARFRAEPHSFSDQELTEKAVPPWLAQEATIAPAWVRRLQTEPAVWLRARPGRGGELARKLGRCQPAGDGPLQDALRYFGSDDLLRRPEFHAGEFELQDVCSQVVGLMCAPAPGETWWDLCAGEGGKTLHLADLMNNRGRVWATDRSLRRLQRLRLRAGRAGVFNYRSAGWSAGQVPPVGTRLHGVLVDAPCSGVGTWQRNPHARWTVQPEDVRELAEVQKRLLMQAAAAVRPGGRLVYSVCTITRSETVEIVNWFGGQFPEFRPLPVPNPLTPDAGVKMAWQLPPFDVLGNDMFVAAWGREAPEVPA